MSRIEQLARAGSFGHGFHRNVRYTLVEVLIVIGIIGTLMYISMPAFEKLLTGTGTDLTARTLTSKLGMARSSAITSRKYVALLMPTPASGLPDDYCFRAFRMCYVGSTSTYDSGTQVTTFTFQRWVEGDSWEFLQIGTVIIHIDNTSGYSATSLAHEQVDGVKCSDIGASYSTINDVKAIIFKPSGKIACNATAYGDRYVTIGEGACAAGSLVRKNPKNEVNIKIEKYTGRVSYGSE
jgi:hypothetical protein